VRTGQVDRGWAAKHGEAPGRASDLSRELLYQEFRRIQHRGTDKLQPVATRSGSAHCLTGDVPGAILAFMTPANRPDKVHLRAFTEADLAFLDRLCTDPDALGEFEWPGFGDPRARRKRWEIDGYVSAESAAVAIARADDTVIGIATWKPRGFPSGVTYEIGVGVLPEHRGQGVGTVAQRLLVDYLFGRTTANRIEALTNGGNLGEQKAPRTPGIPPGRGHARQVLPPRRVCRCARLRPAPLRTLPRNTMNTPPNLVRMRLERAHGLPRSPSAAPAESLAA